MPMFVAFMLFFVSMPVLLVFIALVFIALVFMALVFVLLIAFV